MVCGLEYITLTEPFACEDTIVMNVQYTPEMGVVVTGDGSQSGQVIEGDSFLAECAVVDSNPEAENIRWFDTDGGVVGAGERLEFNTVHRNQTDDAYTCMSSVSFYDGSQGNGSTVFTITVQYLSDVSVQYDDNVTFVEGDTIQATCTADANPDPVFIWVGPDEMEVGHGHLLTLRDVKHGDKGMYTCYANVTFWNGSFRMENASFELNFQFSPVMGHNVTGDASHGGKVIEGDSFAVECLVLDANPDHNDDIQWFDDDMNRVGADEWLIFDGVNKSRAGSYTCTATNTFFNGRVGKGESSITIDVQYFYDVTIQEDSVGKVIKGDTYTANCSAEANPVADIAWLDADGKTVVNGSPLMFDDAKLSDAGLYVCTGDVVFWDHTTKTSNDSFLLDVQFSPIMDLTVTGDASHGGEAIEGDSFAVECLVLDANPDHNDDIQWFDDEMNRVGADEWLMFDKVDKSEAGNYTCTATNTFFNGRVGKGESSITVDVQYFYEITIQEDSDGKVKKGDTYTANCSVEANPMADIAWLDADGKTLVNGSTLMFDDAKLSDAGLYVCTGNVVFWDHITKTSNDSFVLDVQYISDVVIHDESDGKVIEGHIYYANCTADTNPTAVISWTTPDGDVTFVVELAKDDAERADSGNFTCTANVTYWDGTVEVTQSGFYLDVQYQPEVTIFDQSDGKSIEGDRYDAVCQVESNPDSNVVWLDHDDNVVASSPHLTFETIHVNNSGTYTCQASNTLWDGSTATDNATIFIDVQYISDAVVFSENDGIVIEGRPFLANCSVKANPVAQMSWVTPFQDIVFGDVLHINQTSRTESGNYTCVGSVTFWNGSVGESSLTILLDVQYQPEVTIFDQSNGKSIEGDRYDAICQAESNPDSDIIWIGPDDNVVASSPHLTFETIHVNNSGKYTCQASNTLWDGTTATDNATIFIDVQYITDAVVFSENDGMVIEGRPFFANCSVEANPVAQMSWVTPFQDVVFGDILHINMTSRTESGNYTCVGSVTFWNGTVEESSLKILLDVQYQPKVTIFDQSNGKSIEGNRYNAVCQVESNPDSDVVWLDHDDNVVASSPHLTFETILVENSGKYTCQASNTLWDGTTATDNATIFIDVQYITAAVVVSENDGMAIEGRPFHANCSVEANPVAEISWVTPFKDVVFGDVLHINMTSRTDSGNYTCVGSVTFWNGTIRESTSTILLDVQYQPEVTIFDQSDGKSIEGDRYDAVCQVESNPDSEVVWLDHDDNVVASSPHLTFDAIRVNNSGTYTCQASTTLWDGSTATDNATIFIDVQYISDVVVFSENDGMVIEGRPFYANCSVEANPVAQMSWVTTFQDVVFGDVLKINKTSRTESGNYTCVGSVTFWNGTVGESSLTILLDVQYSPNVYIEQASGGKVLEGEHFSAECTADANPDPDTVWQDPHGLVVSVDTSIVIDNTRQDDGGVYTCLANNTLWDGSVGSGNSTIFVDVQYISDAVINYESGGRVIKGQAYYANCSSDANPAAEISWRKPDGETIQSEYVEIDDADKTDDGNYTCIAKTAFWDGTEGQSESSFYLDVQYISDVHIYEENEGKVIEGLGFYANCSSDANPAAVIAWRTPTGGSIDGDELVIGQAERKDGGSYVCIASTTYWDGSSDRSESDVFVDVQYLHEISIFNDNDGQVVESKTYYANCSADSNPFAEISWLTPDGRHTHGRELLIKQVSRIDSGEYRCMATVTFWDGTEESDEKTVIIDVQYISDVLIYDKSNGKVIEGHMYYGNCSSEANPKAVFTWLTPGGDKMPGEELNIDQAVRADSGEYVCSANTTYWDGTVDHRNSTLLLDVQYISDVEINDDSDGKVIQGYPYTANCSADSNPVSVFTWSTPTGEIIENGLLEFSPAQRSDSGHYICGANITYWDGTSDYRHSTLHLDVQYISDVLIYDKSNGKVIEGHRYYVNCSSEANPKAMFTWLTPRGDKMPGEELNIDQAVRADSGEYVCSANTTYWDGTVDHRNSTLLLDVQYIKDVEIDEDSYGKVIQGYQYTANCSADSNPVSDITWSTPTGEIIENGLLEFASVERSDSGDYICGANITYWDGTSDYRQSTLLVDVQYISDAEISDHSGGNVVEGHRYWANCSSNANPAASISWLSPNGERRPHEELVLERSDRSHSGDYACIADTVYWDDTGDSRNSTMHLNVQYLSAAEIYDESSGKVIQGHPYYANCSADTNPTAIISWMMPDGDTLFDPELWFENTDRSDGGDYKCRANVTFWDGSVASQVSTVHMDVQYLSDIVVYMNGTGNVIEGYPFYANCSADANLQPRSPGGQLAAKHNTVDNMSDVLIEDESNGKVIEGHTYLANCSVNANPTATIIWVTPGMEVHESDQLKISQAKRNDTGNYTCEASTEFWDGSDDLRKTSVFVDVQYFPEIEDSELTRKEGDTATLVCVVDANPDPSTYSWSKDEARVSDEMTFSIEDVSRADYGEYVCTATTRFHDGTTGSGQGTTRLFVQYSPDVEGDEVLCKEGDYITLNCDVDANPEAHTYNWTKDGAGLSDQQNYTIKATHRDHAGDYICTAINQFYDRIEGKGHAVIKLEVQYLSTIDMVVSPSAQVNEGQDIRIHCLATDGNPDADKISLIRDTDEVLAEEEGSELQYDIRGINRSHSGVYRCRATTRFYDGSEDFSEEKQNIIVQFSPTIVSKETTFEANIGDTVPMPCKVHGFPTPSVSWFDDNDSLILGYEENKNITEETTKGENMFTSTLTVTVVDKSYYGRYTCNATNRIEPDDERTRWKYVKTRMIREVG
ncbi:hemicentin-2-like [Ptychodera flava]|uniref:hemicentin-2-like n=1 Tax=Ptychodera flava TaxID=63121 RepID=UPI00396A46CF